MKIRFKFLASTEIIAKQCLFPLYIIKVKLVDNDNHHTKLILNTILIILIYKSIEILFNLIPPSLKKSNLNKFASL